MVTDVKNLSASLLAVSVLLTHGEAAANHRGDRGYDDVFAHQVWEQLRQAAFGFLGRNIQMTHEPYIKKLVDGRYDIITFDLEAGRKYWIVGVCDQDCLDIDLELYDENYYLIDRDVEYDDYPLVSVTPQWTGSYELKVTIPTCREWRCTYGVGIFGY